MPLWTCEQCGAQFPESAEPPPACPVCEDERQYVNWKGQTWLTREELTKSHKLVWRDDLGIAGIGVEPGFAIGQRALLVREADGCVMWDCVPLATREAIDIRPLARRPEGDCRLASALLRRGRRLERSVRRRAGLPAWRRPRLRHAAALRHRAVDRRQPQTLRRYLSWCEPVDISPAAR